MLEKAVGGCGNDMPIDAPLFWFLHTCHLRRRMHPASAVTLKHESYPKVPVAVGPPDSVFPCGRMPVFEVA